MPAKKVVAIVSACMKRDGTPAFALSDVEVTDEEMENGIQYYLAEGELLLQGFEEPFVHFEESESPPFLHPAVRQHLSVSPALTITAIEEGSECPVSSK